MSQKKNHISTILRQTRTTRWNLENFLGLKSHKIIRQSNSILRALVSSCEPPFDADGQIKPGCRGVVEELKRYAKKIRDIKYMTDIYNFLLGPTVQQRLATKRGRLHQGRWFSREIHLVLKDNGQDILEIFIMVSSGWHGKFKIQRAAPKRNASDIFKNSTNVRMVHLDKLKKTLLKLISIGFRLAPEGKSMMGEGRRYAGTIAPDIRRLRF